jgi:hypothetical protein
MEQCNVWDYLNFTFWANHYDWQIKNSQFFFMALLMITEDATEVRGGRTNEGRGKPIPEIIFGEGIPSEWQPTPWP